MTDNKTSKAMAYEAARQQLLEQGYKETKAIISIVKANILALITTLPFVVLCCVLYFPKAFGDEFIIVFDVFSSFGFIITLIASIIVHEFLHGFTWRFFCKNSWKSIKFGVQWKIITPYCHCREALSFGAYLLGGLMPFIVLGAGIFVLAYIYESMFLFLLSMFGIIGAGGDITIALMLLKYRKAYIFDHPNECGFIAFTK
ncbi:MAG: hypothetical protein A2Y17_00890 [Clostridiales bacterium GWF2_38_85]|nr:MAG: hypothetical protein A2Y17_00890 [Clostridiales bacterium GWF2_38_85]HBL84551.1 DUF3267 domain-containing protein [Clostridiales bacterium]